MSVITAACWIMVGVDLALIIIVACVAVWSLTDASRE